jgi:hypothetical protein
MFDAQRIPGTAASSAVNATTSQTALAHLEAPNARARCVPALDSLMRFRESR